MEDASAAGHAGPNLQLRSRVNQQLPLAGENLPDGSAGVSSPQHAQRPRRFKAPSAVIPSTVHSKPSLLSSVQATSKPRPSDFTTAGTSAEAADPSGKDASCSMHGGNAGGAGGAVPEQTETQSDSRAVRVRSGTEKRSKPNRRLFPSAISEPVADAEPLLETVVGPTAGGLCESSGGRLVCDLSQGDRGTEGAEEAGRLSCVEAKDALHVGGDGVDGSENVLVQGGDVRSMLCGQLVGKEQGQEGEEGIELSEKTVDDGEKVWCEEEKEEDSWLKELREAWSERGRCNERHGRSKGSHEALQLEHVAMPSKSIYASEAAHGPGAAPRGATVAGAEAEAASVPMSVPCSSGSSLLTSPVPETWEEDPVYQGMAYVGCTHQYTPAHFLRFREHWQQQQQH